MRDDVSIDRKFTSLVFASSLTPTNLMSGLQYSCDSMRSGFTIQQAFHDCLSHDHIRVPASCLPQPLYKPAVVKAPACNFPHSTISGVTNFGLFAILDDAIAKYLHVLYKFLPEACAAQHACGADFQTLSC